MRSPRALVAVVRLNLLLAASALTLVASERLYSPQARMAPAVTAPPANRSKPTYSDGNNPVKDASGQILAPLLHDALVMRRANSAPLGALQPAGLLRASAPLPGPPATPRYSAGVVGKGCGGSGPSTREQTAGLDDRVVRSFIRGEVSEGLCVARLLDSLVRGATSASTRSVPATPRDVRVDLGELVAVEWAVLGDIVNEDLLYQLVGGLPDLLSSLPNLAGTTEWKGVDGADLPSGVATALRWFRHGAGHPQSAPSTGGASARLMNPRLDGHEATLVVLRLRLQVHPQRDKGDLARYVLAHLHTEVLRRWQMGEGVAKLEEPCTEEGHLTDADLLALLRRAPSPLRRTRRREPPHASQAVHARALGREATSLEATLAETKLHGAYCVLGLPPGSSQTAIQRAYRDRARILHPDHGGSKEGFQALQAAYEKLMSHRTGGGARKEADSKAVVFPGVEVRIEPLAQLAEAAISDAMITLRLAELHGAGEETARRRVRQRAVESALQVGRSACGAGTMAQELAEKALPLVQEVLNSNKRDLPEDESVNSEFLSVGNQALALIKNLLLVGKVASQATSRGKVVWSMALEGGDGSAILAFSDAASSAAIAAAAAALIAASVRQQAASLASALVKAEGILAAAVAKANKQADSSPVPSEAESSSDESLPYSDSSDTMDSPAHSAKSNKEAPGSANDEALPSEDEKLVDGVAQEIAGEEEKNVAGNTCEDCDDSFDIELGLGPRSSDSPCNGCDEGQSRDEGQSQGEPRSPGSPCNGCDEGRSQFSGRPRRRGRRKKGGFRKELLDLNQIVTDLQHELRKAAMAKPCLIQGEVIVPQKEALFGFVAEILGAAAAAAVRGAMQARGDDVALTVTQALSVAFAAMSWREVARPSFNARLLRLAALVDSALLARLMQRELFQPSLLLVRGHPGEEDLRRRCEAALAAVAPPEAVASAAGPRKSRG